AAILDGAGLRRPFLVVDPAVATIPQLAAALAVVAPVAEWPIPAHEPTTASVEAAGAALAAADADVVIAVGGGSALDTAKGTPIGDAVGLEATRLCAQAYPTVVRDGADAAARNRMLLGSMMAGLAMNISEAGTEHALAEPLGHAFGLPHGLTIGLVLAESMD